IQIAIINFRAEVKAVRGVDELGRNPDAIAELAHAPLKNGRHSQFAPYLARVNATSFVAEDRAARGDFEFADLREAGNDLLGHSIAKVLILWIGAHIVEREDGDRPHAGGGFYRLWLPRFFAGDKIVNLDWLFDVAKLPFSEVSEGEVFLIADLLVDLAGNINTSRGNQGFDPAGNINPAAKELLAFLQQVPKM